MNKKTHAFLVVIPSLSVIFLAMFLEIQANLQEVLSYGIAQFVSFIINIVFMSILVDLFISFYIAGDGHPTKIPKDTYGIADEIKA